jgi:uncharacterized protein YjiS (DUF1127 family)
MANVLNLNAYAAHDARPGILTQLRHAVMNRLEYLRLRDELEALSDRELSDIGLARHSIRDIARQSVYDR